ncbi:hypothetical protein G7009_08670 [Pseudomonas capeferrum]|uniref:hypothetical protein n=1 Tax=Pseudomonas capeferrum TaxID=1495066 RepID=UPI0015E407F2|nr:hypothetical protein [Pseudomonas capeferrum]MBA1201833.1 hypothetical protein [Pseudomonas capeferrum]
MMNHIQQRSFIAHVRSTTEGYEGYLDFAKIVPKKGSAARVADDWMIVTSLQATREPHYFWFRCMEEQRSGARYYDIQSWSRRTGRDFNAKSRYLDLGNSGYAGLYDQQVGHDRLWSVMTLKDDEFISVGDELNVGQAIPAQFWTCTNQVLCAYKRETVAEHWFAYAASSGGPILALSLEITHIGEELLDDH